jgi:hypothetical protein
MIPAAFAILAAAAATPLPAPVQTVTISNREAQRGLSAPSCETGCMSAIEAVTYASYLGNKGGVAGLFDMPVVEVGQQDGLFYLNSESDYRDRNCLTVAMTPAAMQALVGTTDLAQIRKRLNGHRVIVRGVARQVRINFFANGRPTEKYYYQVHVRVGEPEQVRIST